MVRFCIAITSFLFDSADGAVDSTAWNVLSRRNMHARKFIHILFLLIFLGTISHEVRAEEQDETLTLLGQPAAADPVAGRLPRQLSRTAENTTVVTSREIEALNAHTLVDILATVPGIQLESQVGSANGAFIRIQGSLFNHVLVLLDGIPYNNLGDNFADIGQIPARIIERVEIVKGAASSAWGQALGGVVNVITKSPDPERGIGGMATVAQGERGTRDIGGELSGTLDRFGYYFSGSYLASGGFTPNTGFDSANGHARLSWELPQQGQATFLANYSRHDRGEFAFVPNDVQSRDNAHRVIIGLSLRQPFGSHMEMELNGFHSDNRIGIATATLSDRLPLQTLRNNELLSGGGGRLLWRQSGNLLVAGVDYQHARLDDNDTLVHVDILNRHADRWGFYLNDTLNLGPVSLSTGARYDLTGSSGDQFSPSFGLTWQLTDSTLLRGYTAKGYSLPAFTLERGSERVWTSQVGLESSALPYLWLKGTLFRNDTREITTRDPVSGAFGSERQIRQGFEVEARTAEAFHTSLRSGYTYVDARRSTDNSVVLDIPTQTVQLGLQYDNHKNFKGLLTGRHIFWNAEAYHNGSYQGMLWDLHLNTTPFSGNFKRLELFFSLRNIFNGSQYLDEFYRNNGRWAEGGVRFRF
ncbi:MAG TPA: TonB-dependent receptor [Dongiaceae bacterium]|nr:TonB-dependent receptor [Dongiaceae bacterium]